MSPGGGVGEGVGVGTGVGEGLEVGVGVGEGEAVGVGVGEELGAGEGEGVGVGNMSPVPSGSPLSKFVSDTTYTTKDTSKQAQTNKAINAFLLIFHLH
jgi:hypothetical protein